MPEHTIGDWSEQQLIRFVQNIMDRRPNTGMASFLADDLTVVKKLTCLDQVQLMQVQTTVGAAGSASALPASPAGYFKIYDNGGGLFVIPYYKAS